MRTRRLNRVSFIPRGGAHLMTRWPATIIRMTTVINRSPPMRIVPLRLSLLSDRT